MRINYNAPSDAYPFSVYNALFMLIKPIALEWIEKNKPMAWYKAMFE